LSSESTTIGTRAAFRSIDSITAIERYNEHAGCGPISFRRIFSDLDFESPIDFVDYTEIPPGSSIGRHEHQGNEEIYYIAGGTPLMTVDDRNERLKPGSFAVVRDGGSHKLQNDTTESVKIVIIQVRNT
jgi:Cupin domain